MFGLVERYSFPSIVARDKSADSTHPLRSLDRQRRVLDAAHGYDKSL